VARDFFEDQASGFMEALRANADELRELRQSQRDLAQAVRDSRETTRTLTELTARGQGVMGAMRGSVGALGVFGASAPRGLAGEWNAANNMSMSYDQRARAAAESIPVLGATLVRPFNDLRDALTGVNEQLRQAAVGLARFRESMAGRAEVFSTRLGASARWAQQAYRADTLAAYGTPAGVGDPNDPRAYAYAEQRAGAQLPLWQARGELAAQERYAAAARRDVGRPDWEGMNRLWESATSLGQKATRGATQQERSNLAHAAVGDELRLQEKYTQALKGQEEVQRSLLDLAQRRSDVRKGEVVLQQRELEVLKQQESLTRGQFQSFGRLHRGEQAAALQAARQARQFGQQSLSPEQLQLLERGGAGDYVARLLEQRGAASPFAGEFRALTGMQGGAGELERVLREKVRVAQEIQIAVQVDNQKLAQEVADALAERMKDLVRLTELRVQSRQRQAEQERIIGNHERR
jgi:hypothetical protein